MQHFETVSIQFLASISLHSYDSSSWSSMYSNFPNSSETSKKTSCPIDNILLGQILLVLNFSVRRLMKNFIHLTPFHFCYCTTLFSRKLCPLHLYLLYHFTRLAPWPWLCFFGSDCGCLVLALVLYLWLCSWVHCFCPITLLGVHTSHWFSTCVHICWLMVWIINAHIFTLWPVCDLLLWKSTRTHWNSAADPQKLVHCATNQLVINFLHSIGVSPNKCVTQITATQHEY